LLVKTRLLMESVWARQGCSGDAVVMVFLSRSGLVKIVGSMSCD